VMVDLPRPRNLDDARYLSVRDRIFSIMGLDAQGGGTAKPL
jgi:hypothetical protein